MKKYLPFIQYGIVGSIGTAVDVGSLYVLVNFLHVHLLLATAISFALAVVNNFVLNKYWTFRNRSSNIRKQFIKFLIVSLVGLAWTELFMGLFVYAFGIWYIAAKLMTSAIVLMWNFLANKYWTFRDRVFAVAAGDACACEISVIVPAYNEAKRIGPTLKAIDSYFSGKGLTREIIVVDDGSRDGTTEVVEGLEQAIPRLRAVRYTQNRGKGHAVKTGVEEASGKFILFTDADNSTPIEEFDRFYPMLAEVPVVIGSRYVPGSNVVIRQPFYRVFIGRLGNALIRFFLLDDVSDTQCGFKAMRSAAAKEIFARMKIDRFGFDIEMLAIARLLNYRVREMPVSWYNSAESRVRPVKDALRTLAELVYIKLNLLSGRYL